MNTVKIARKDLETVTKVLSSMLDKKSRLPLLAYTRLEADYASVKFTVINTGAKDYTQAARLTIPAILTDGESFTILLPVIQLRDTVKTMSGDILLIQYEEKSSEVVIASPSGASMRINRGVIIWDINEFPGTHFGTHTGNGTSAVHLREALKQVYDATAEGNERPVLSAVFMPEAGNEVCAADGFRMHMVTDDLNCDLEVDALIPNLMVKHILQGKSKDACYLSSRLIDTNDGKKVVVYYMEGDYAHRLELSAVYDATLRYPDLHVIIPRRKPDYCNSVTLDPEQAKSWIEHMKGASRAETAYLGARLELTASKDDPADALAYTAHLYTAQGEYLVDRLPVYSIHCPGDYAKRIAFNPGYMADILTAGLLTGEKIVIDFDTPTNPIRVTSGNLLTLCMPMHIAE